MHHDWLGYVDVGCMDKLTRFADQRNRAVRFACHVVSVRDQLAGTRINFWVRGKGMLQTTFVINLSDRIKVRQFKLERTGSLLQRKELTCMVDHGCIGDIFGSSILLRIFRFRL